MTESSDLRGDCFYDPLRSWISQARMAQMSGEVKNVTDENYEEFVQAPAAVVAYGIATCEPCKAYDPVLEESAHQYPEVRFGKAKMHVPGRCRAIKKRHQFETYPTTHFFSRGDLVLTKEGKLEAAELADLIQQHFPRLT